jgi:hypothetical protein
MRQSKSGFGGALQSLESKLANMDTSSLDSKLDSLKKLLV